FNLLSKFSSRKIIALGGIAIGNIKLIGLTKSIGFAGISAFNKKKGP
ncbi:thiamine monophosphate synthase, partial [Pelagibacteraceae bacterium GOM-A3]